MLQNMSSIAVGRNLLVTSMKAQMDIIFNAYGFGFILWIILEIQNSESAISCTNITLSL